MDIVLNTYGTSLCRDNDAFVVKNSNGSKRISPDGIGAILVNKGVSISSDAVFLAVEHQIPIHFVDRKGSPIGLLWSYKYGSISTIRKNQIAFCSSRQGLSRVKAILRRKLENSQAMLFMVDTDVDRLKPRFDSAIARLERFKQRLDAVDGNNVRSVADILRGIEGSAGRLYFKTLNIAIPEQYRFDERSQHPARDVANALLNYAYGMLYGKVEMALIKAGLDPYLGLLHRDEYNRPALAFDMIELYRVWADYVVYTLLAQNAVVDDYFSQSHNGAVWLEPLGRRGLIQSLNDYLDELVDSPYGNRSRDTIITLDAQRLAQEIKNFTDNNNSQQ